MLETPLDFKKYIFYRHLEHTEEAQKLEILVFVAVI